MDRTVLIYIAIFGFGLFLSIMFLLAAGYRIGRRGIFTEDPLLLGLYRETKYRHRFKSKGVRIDDMKSDADRMRRFYICMALFPPVSLSSQLLVQMFLE